MDNIPTQCSSADEYRVVWPAHWALSATIVFGVWRCDRGQPDIGWGFNAVTVECCCVFRSGVASSRQNFLALVQHCGAVVRVAILCAVGDTGLVAAGILALMAIVIEPRQVSLAWFQRLIVKPSELVIITRSAKVTDLNRFRRTRDRRKPGLRTLPIR